MLAQDQSFVQLRCMMDRSKPPTTSRGLIAAVARHFSRGKTVLLQGCCAAVLMFAAVSSSVAQAGPAAKPAFATDRSLILAVLKRIADGERWKDFSTIRDTGWPGAIFSIRSSDEPLAQAHGRAWNEPIFNGSGVSARVLYSPPRIRWAGNRAMIKLRGVGGFLCQNDDGKFVPDGSRFREYNSIVMERRGRQWRVSRWDRAIQDLPPTSLAPNC